MDEIILLIQKTYGIVGILILAPLAACVFLFKELEKRSESLQALAEQRVQDAQTFSGKLLEVAKEQIALSTEANLALSQLNAALGRLHETRWSQTEKIPPRR